MVFPKPILLKEEDKWISPDDEVIEILDDSDTEEKVREENKPSDEPLVMECQSDEDEEFKVKIEESEAYIELNAVSNQTSEKDPLAPEESENPSDEQLETTENYIQIPPKKVFKCVACPFWSPKASSVSIHYNRFHLEKNNTNEKFSLELHMETNHKDLMKDRHKAQSKSDLNSGFTCNSCEFNTLQVIDLKHHILRYHPLSYDKYLLCDWCDFLSLDSNALKNHKMARHDSQVLSNAVLSELQVSNLPLYSVSV